MKPVIGVTMGDAAGIGPEIIIKALRDPQLHQMCTPLVIGDAKRLQQVGGMLGLETAIVRVQRTDRLQSEFPGILCVDLDMLPEDLPFGQVSGAAGAAAFAYLKRAAELALSGDIQAICTAPLNKEALRKGGYAYPGHTEILADLTNSPDVFMMLTAPGLRVVHVTTHVGLLDAVARIHPERVYKTIRCAHETLQRARVPSPRIAVCGINPHAGENGLFGHGEEEEKIVPAVRRAREEGIDAVGPLPADTLFFRAKRGDFDIVVAMYHDQGHGPIKVLGLEAGVNISLGLPIVRTSVDHGTAFDIAGQGIADERSLQEAIRQAVELAPYPS